MILEDRAYQQTCIRIAYERYLQKRTQYDPQQSLYEKHKLNEDYFVLPCGTGKTVVFNEFIREVTTAFPDVRVIVLAHREELLLQAKAKYQAINPLAYFGKISKKSRDYHAQIVAASIQMVAREKHLTILKSIHGTGENLLIIADECHHTESSEYQRFFKAFPDAYILGCTATPHRLDQKQLFHSKQPFYSMSLLEGMGFPGPKYLCTIRAYAPRTDILLKDIALSKQDFSEKALAEAIDRDDRNACVVRAYQKYAPGKSAICFGVTVEHIQNIAEAFTAAGIPASAITGPMSPEERETLYRKLRTKEILVLCSVYVLAEGYDDPSIECVIMARPTKSVSLYTQCLDAQTEILTIQGWKTIHEVQKGDIVAGFDKETDKIQWVPALNKVDRALAPGERMFELESPSLNFRVTGGHRMLYRTRSGRAHIKDAWEFIEAQDLYARPTEYEVPISGIQDARGIPLTDAEIRFVGWFMTDGCLNKVTNAITISQAAHQPYHKDIQECLVTCGLKYARYEVVPKSQFHANSNGILYVVSKGKPRGTDKHLTGWGHLEAYIDKEFPPLLEDMSVRQLEVLLETMNMADGSKQRQVYTSHGSPWTRRSYTISKGNKIFVERLQSICVRRGFKCNISHITSETGICYRLHIKQVSTRYIGGKHATDRPHMEISTTQPHEHVWCVENELGTLVTRRKGKVTIVGNCIGRGTRLFPGKEECILLDMTDSWQSAMMQPTTFSTAINKDVQEGETVGEALDRALQEASLAQERKTNTVEEGRLEDVVIDIFNHIVWEERKKSYVAVAGKRKKHQVAIIPSKIKPGLYGVHIQLALQKDAKGVMQYDVQCALSQHPLEVCRQFATHIVLKLHEGATKLVDRKDPWRSKPITEGQEKFMKWHNIPFGKGTRIENCGQASDVIDVYKIYQSLAKKEGDTSA